VRANVEGQQVVGSGDYALQGHYMRFRAAQGRVTGSLTRGASGGRRVGGQVGRGGVQVSGEVSDGWSDSNQQPTESGRERFNLEQIGGRH